MKYQWIEVDNPTWNVSLNLGVESGFKIAGGVTTTVSAGVKMDYNDADELLGCWAAPMSNIAIMQLHQ